MRSDAQLALYSDGARYIRQVLPSILRARPSFLEKRARALFERGPHFGFKKIVAHIVRCRVVRGVGLVPDKKIEEPTFLNAART